MDLEEPYALTAVRFNGDRLANEAPANVDHRMPKTFKPYVMELKSNQKTIKFVKRLIIQKKPSEFFQENLLVVNDSIRIRQVKEFNYLG